MKTTLTGKVGRLARAGLVLSAVANTFILTAAAQAENRLVMMETMSVVDLGRYAVGTSSPAKLLTFSAAGAGSLVVTRVRMTGQNPTDFVITSDSCTNAVLSTSSTCTVTVGFAPAAGGSRTARLSIETNAGGAPNEVPVTGYGIDPLRGPARAAGPVDLRFGFPAWHQDDAGLRLQLCLDNNGMCLGTAPDSTSGPAISDAFINFPDEAFWWYAEARPARPSGGKVLLVLAKEAAFLNGVAGVGEQMTFDRVRIRVDRLVAGRTYTVTHPFGVISLKADARGEIDHTEDIGCIGSPCDFEKSLTGKLTRFLRWDPAVAPAAPAGYIGDPNILHRVTGSPSTTNFFKVEGPNAGGTNINVIQTNLFSVQGKLATN